MGGDKVCKANAARQNYHEQRMCALPRRAPMLTSRERLALVTIRERAWTTADIRLHPAWCGNVVSKFIAALPMSTYL
jgi:hypothetical protein